MLEKNDGFAYDPAGADDDDAYDWYGVPRDGRRTCPSVLLLISPELCMSYTTGDEEDPEASWE